MSSASRKSPPQRNEGAGSLELSLQIATRSRFVPAARPLRRWAQAAAAAMPGAARVTVRIVGAPEGRRLNREYRGRDYATNVLSFVYGHEDGPAGPAGSPCGDAVLCGDLVLCAPVVARVAREQGKTLAAHYAHMVVHGLLHLQGHDHIKPRQAERMENLERGILKSLGYADPYA